MEECLAPEFVEIVQLNLCFIYNKSYFI